jgi:hypothetical protein
MRCLGGLMLVTSGALGCGPPGSLREISEKHLSVVRFGGTEDTLRVYLSHSAMPPCPELGTDFQGTVNGAPLTVRSTGGDRQEGFRRRCNMIELSGPVPGPGDVAIRLWDSSQVIEAEFPELFSDRRLELIEPADRVLYVGDRVVLRRWPPGEQLVDIINHTQVFTEVPVSSKSWRVDGKLVGSDVLFEVPEAPFHVEGSSQLALFDGDILTPARLCTGVTSCRGLPANGTGRTEPVMIFNRKRFDHVDCYRCECQCTSGGTVTHSRRSRDGSTPIPVNCSPMSCSTSCQNAVAAAVCTAPGTPM